MILPATVTIETCDALHKVGHIEDLIDTDRTMFEYDRGESYEFQTAAAFREDGSRVTSIRYRHQPNGLRVSAFRNAAILGFGATIALDTATLTSDSLFWFGDRIAANPAAYRADLIGHHLEVTEQGEIRVRWPTSPVEQIDGPAFLLMNPSDLAFTHLLMDILPKLVLWRLFPHPRPRLLISENARLRWRHLLPLFGITPDNSTVVGARSVLHCTQIYVASFPHWSHQESINLLRSAVSGYPAGERRILVLRRDNFAWDRKLLNENAIAALLEKNGFEIVVPSGMDFTRQLQLYRSAAFVAGIFGGGILNAVFSPPGTKILSIVSPDYHRRWLDESARFTQLEVVEAIGESFSALRDRNNSPFLVDERAVLAALEEIG